MIKALFFLAVTLSLLSQLPMLLESGVGMYLKLSWVPLTIVLLFLYPSDFLDKKACFFWIFMVVFGLYCLIAQGCTGFNYYTSGNDYYNISISSIIFINSYIFWKHNASLKIYKRLVFLILCSCVILALIVYLLFLKDADLTSTVYAFKAKNSMGQILFAGGFLAFAIHKYYNKRTKIIIYVSIAILLIIIMQLRSRATILCIVFVLSYYVLKIASPSNRIKFITLFTIVIAFILINQASYELIINNILFANRNATSVNSLSSGRTELIAEAFNQINTHPILGIGNSYLDCMPVAMLLQYGIIGSFIIFSFIVYIAVRTHYLIKNVINFSTFILFWSFILNSLFEAYPPFGPGAKCFTLWMLIGFSFADKNILSKYSSSNTSIII